MDESDLPTHDDGHPAGPSVEQDNILRKSTVDMPLLDPKDRTDYWVSFIIYCNSLILVR